MFRVIGKRSGESGGLLYRHLCVTKTLRKRKDKTNIGSKYMERKISHGLPDNKVSSKFEPLHGMPSGVFRITTGEFLGPCAGPQLNYKNSEYFSFHNMSFFDLNMCLSKYRCKRVASNRKR